jgi:hypothetical protein
MTHNHNWNEESRRAVALRAAEKLALNELHRAAEQIEQATGQRILNRRPEILNARRPDLDRLRLQAQAWLLAMAIIDKQMAADDCRTLGDIFKITPRGELDELRRALRLAGALHDGGRHDD